MSFCLIKTISVWAEKFNILNQRLSKMFYLLFKFLRGWIFQKRKCPNGMKFLRFWIWSLKLFWFCRCRHINLTTQTELLWQISFFFYSRISMEFHHSAFQQHSVKSFSLLKIKINFFFFWLWNLKSGRSWLFLPKFWLVGQNSNLIENILCPKNAKNAIENYFFSVWFVQ
jgi:hypothetical protein